MGRKRIADKARINEFWRFGETLLQGGLAIADLYDYLSNVDAENRKKGKMESINKTKTDALPEERKRAIEEFATCKVGGKYTVYEELPKMIATYIAGNEELKLALCYSLASKPEKPLHMLMIGNPASVKSDLLNEAKKMVPTAVMGGPRSTEAGLTINSQDGSPGLLLLANNGVALVDEFDKIQKSEINTTYEALESGKISINTGKFKGEYATKFICIAAANPKGGRFREQTEFIRDQIEKVIAPPLLSRFHMTFLLRKETHDETEEAITMILSRKEKSNSNWKFLREYFIYICQKCAEVEYDFDRNSPIVKEMSTFIMRSLEMSEKGSTAYFLTKRFAEALKRISISSARLRLSKKVEEVDVRNAIDILNFALDTASTS